MQTELEKLDALRSRVRVSYEEAKDALDRSSGDLVAALIDLEKRGSSDMLSAGIELLDEVQALLESGAPRRLRLKYGDRLVREFPVALGVAAVFAVGFLAVLISKTSIEIDREEEVSEGA